MYVKLLTRTLFQVDSGMNLVEVARVYGLFVELEHVPFDASQVYDTNVREKQYQVFEPKSFSSNAKRMAETTKGFSLSPSCP